MARKYLTDGIYVKGDDNWIEITSYQTTYEGVLISMHPEVLYNFVNLKCVKKMLKRYDNRKNQKT